jgi:hypothetical protein
MSEATLGGWSDWDFTPSEESQKAFADSLGKLLGVKYTMVACKNQLVNGMNYLFLCEASTVSPLGPDYIVEAFVYQLLNGTAVIRKIRQVGPRPGAGFGSWQDWLFSVSGNAAAVFKLAMEHFYGGDYKPLAYSSQVVAGKNYCFLCEVTPAILHPEPSPVLVWIDQPLHGNPVIRQITPIGD